jgi:hypothetical protein
LPTRKSSRRVDLDAQRTAGQFEGRDGVARSGGSRQGGGGEQCGGAEAGQSE